jgi:PcfJ-like protein
VSGERIRYADGALDDIASVLCTAHPRAAQYLEQAPALAVATCQKLTSHLTYGEVDRFAAIVGLEPRLKTVLDAYGMPKQARSLRPDALRLSDRDILKHLYALNPSTSAQVLPGERGQRSWLSGCSVWLRTRFPDRLPLDWIARQLCEDQSRVQQIDQLVDWIERGHGIVHRGLSWTGAMAAVEAWHISLRSEADLRRMLANKALAERYDSTICHAPIPDATDVDDYQFVALRTPRSLRDEGAALRHCVGSYDRQVEAGRSAIVSIRRQGVRIATAEYGSSQRYARTGGSGCRRAIHLALLEACGGRSMIAAILTAWFAASIATGLLIGSMIAVGINPPTTDDRQHGEGERVRGDHNLHGSAMQHD